MQRLYMQRLYRAVGGHMCICVTADTVEREVRP